MLPQERADFREIVIASCCQVLPQCGLPIDPEPIDLTELTEDLNTEVAGFIGFTAERLRGSVTILAPTGLVRDAYPLSMKTGLEGNLELFDWCGEIVNRLLGHIKGGLAVRGIEIEPSTPKAIMGDAIRLIVQEKCTVCSLQLRCKGTSIGVFVDAMTSGDAPLFGEPKHVEGAAKEGEFVLF